MITLMINKNGPIKNMLRGILIPNEKIKNNITNDIDSWLISVIEEKSMGKILMIESLEKSKDIIVVNRDEQLSIAKSYARILADAGYVKPIERTDIKVLGKQALGMFMVGTDAMKAGNYISEYDLLMADKLAYVMSGGDLSAATTVSERYLLDIEREAFLSLCGQRKTLERIQHMLTTGKPLRN